MRLRKLKVISLPDTDVWADSAASNEAADVLMWFGASTLRAGSTAIRTREQIETMALEMSFDTASAILSLDGITATFCRSGRCRSARKPPGRRSIGFTIGALAMGLATTRFFIPR